MNIICDEKNTTASDYGLCVKFIPNHIVGADYDEEIRKSFKLLGYELTSISLSYNLTEYQMINDKIAVVV